MRSSNADASRGSTPTSAPGQHRVPRAARLVADRRRRAAPARRRRHGLRGPAPALERAAAPGRSHRPTGRGASARPPRYGGRAAVERRRRAPRRRRGAAATRARARPPRAPAGRNRAAEQQRVGRPGGNAGRRPSRSRRATAGRTWRVWPESHCAAPSTSHAQRIQRATRGGRDGGGSRVVVGDVAAGEQRGGREHQHLQRALDVGGAVGELARAEHVQLALAGPADDVAARRRARSAGGRAAATAARRRAAPPSECSTTASSPGRASKRSSSRARAYSSCASTRSASSASRSSWRATNVSEAVSTQPTTPWVLARRGDGAS